MRGFLRVLAVLLVVLAMAVAAGLVWGRAQLRSSLPQLDGERQVPGLTSPVRVSRDSFGIPTIRAESRADAALATGFLHGQDRFFQMDLSRRRAAGELAALVGARAVPVDREIRIHRFRAEARQACALLGVKELAFHNVPAALVAEQPHWQLNRDTLAVVEDTRPDVLFVPFAFDLHRDHRELFHSFSVAWRPCTEAGRRLLANFVERVRARRRGDRLGTALARSAAGRPSGDLVRDPRGMDGERHRRARRRVGTGSLRGITCR